MKETSGWRGAVAAIAGPFLWVAAWLRTARTTFEVVRLLDREQRLLATVPVRVGTRAPFVARTGYIV